MTKRVNFGSYSEEVSDDEQEKPLTAEMQDMIAYLKKHLQVRIAIDHDNDWYSTGIRVQAELVLGDEVITSDYSTITTGSR